MFWELWIDSILFEQNTPNWSGVLYAMAKAKGSADNSLTLEANHEGGQPFLVAFLTLARPNFFIIGIQEHKTPFKIGFSFILWGWK